MKKRTQQLCALCGVFCSIGWLLGAWLAGFLPPPEPSMTPAEIGEIYRTNTNMLRLGFIILGAGSCLYLPWSAAISVQMKRIEGENSPLTYTQLGMGAVFVWVFFIPVMIWLAAAYRPEETPDLILQRMNDFGWLTFINPVATIFVQGMAIGLAILQDKRKNPIFPRWFGYFNIWAVITYLPGILVPFFKDGIFAWDGLLALWVPLVIFVFWMCAMSYFLLKAIDTQEEFSGANASSA